MCIFKKRAVHTLRVNIKSLAAEARFIRREIKKTKNTEIKNYLYWHNVYKVRTEARSAQLALAALKNTPYDVVEPYSKTEPDWKRIEGKFNKHVTLRKHRDNFQSWLSSAKAYWKSQNE